MSDITPGGGGIRRDPSGVISAVAALLLYTRDRPEAGYVPFQVFLDGLLFDQVTHYEHTIARIVQEAARMDPSVQGYLPRALRGSGPRRHEARPASGVSMDPTIEREALTLVFMYAGRVDLRTQAFHRFLRTDEGITLYRRIIAASSSPREQVLAPDMTSVLPSASDLYDAPDRLRADFVGSVQYLNRTREHLADVLDKHFSRLERRISSGQISAPPSLAEEVALVRQNLAARADGLDHPSYHDSRRWVGTEDYARFLIRSGLTASLSLDDQREILDAMYAVHPAIEAIGQSLQNWIDETSHEPPSWALSPEAQQMTQGMSADREFLAPRTVRNILATTGVVLADESIDFRTEIGYPVAQTTIPRIPSVVQEMRLAENDIVRFTRELGGFDADDQLSGQAALDALDAVLRAGAAQYETDILSIEDAQTRILLQMIALDERNAGGLTVTRRAHQNVRALADQILTDASLGQPEAAAAVHDAMRFLVAHRRYGPALEHQNVLLTIADEDNLLFRAMADPETRTLYTTGQVSAQDTFTGTPAMVSVPVFDHIHFLRSATVAAQWNTIDRVQEFITEEAERDQEVLDEDEIRTQQALSIIGRVQPPEDDQLADAYFTLARDLAIGRDSRDTEALIDSLRDAQDDISRRRHIIRERELFGRMAQQLALHPVALDRLRPVVERFQKIPEVERWRRASPDAHVEVTHSLRFEYYSSERASHVPIDLRETTGYAQTITDARNELLYAQASNALLDFVRRSPTRKNPLTALQREVAIRVAGGLTEASASVRHTSDERLRQLAQSRASLDLPADVADEIVSVLTSVRHVAQPSENVDRAMDAAMRDVQRVVAEGLPDLDDHELFRGRTIDGRTVIPSMREGPDDDAGGLLRTGGPPKTPPGDRRALRLPGRRRGRSRRPPGRHHRNPGNDDESPRAHEARTGNVEATRPADLDTEASGIRDRKSQQQSPARATDEMDLTEELLEVANRAGASAGTSSGEAADTRGREDGSLSERDEELDDVAERIGAAAGRTGSEREEVPTTREETGASWQSGR